MNNLAHDVYTVHIHLQRPHFHWTTMNFIVRQSSLLSNVMPIVVSSLYISPAKEDVRRQPSVMSHIIKA